MLGIEEFGDKNSLGMKVVININVTKCEMPCGKDKTLQ